MSPDTTFKVTDGLQKNNFRQKKHVNTERSFGDAISEFTNQNGSVASNVFTHQQSTAQKSKLAYLLPLSIQPQFLPLAFAYAVY